MGYVSAPPNRKFHPVLNPVHKIAWSELPPNVKVRTLDIAPLRESPPQQRSGMARVVKGSHSFTKAIYIHVLWFYLYTHAWAIPIRQVALFLTKHSYWAPLAAWVFLTLNLSTVFMLLKPQGEMSRSQENKMSKSVLSRSSYWQR